jgi:hypothetical protein
MSEAVAWQQDLPLNSPRSGELKKLPHIFQLSASLFFCRSFLSGKNICRSKNRYFDCQEKTPPATREGFGFHPLAIS